MVSTAESNLAGRVAFTHPNFVLFVVARFFMVSATEMQSVAVGWQVYEITRRPLDLGLIGLVQFAPGILLFLVSGQTADRFNRRNILICCYAGFTVCSSLLLILMWRGIHSALPIYAVMTLVGVVRSFSGPVTRAIQPQLVPEEHFPNAVAWNSITNQS